MESRLHGFCGGVLSIKLPLARIRPLGKLSIILAIAAVVIQPFSVLGAPRVGAVATSLFSDSFESAIEFDGWTAGANWDVINSNAQDGNKRADYIGSTDNIGAELTQTVDTTGYENVELSFYYKRDGLDTAEYGKVSYAVNGTEYELATYEGAPGDTDTDAEWKQARLSLPEAANQTDVTIVFRGNADADNDKFKIDNVVLSADEITVPADKTAPTSELVDPGTPTINPSDILVRVFDETELAEIHTVISNDDGVVDECSKLEIGTNEETLSCTLVASLPDGAYSAVFYGVDATGNMSEPGVFSFTVDHTLPSLSIVVPEDGLVTNVGAMYVSGTASDELTEIEKVDYKVEKVASIAGAVIEELYSGTAQGTESWQFNALSLPSGTYRVTVTAYDLAGNGRSQAHDVLVDTIKPTVSISAPQTDDEIQSKDFSVVANASDAESGLASLRVDLFSGTQLLSYISSCYQQSLVLPVSTTDLQCDIDVNTLPAGNYVLRYNAVDAAGNASEPIFWKFRILSGTIVLAPSVPAGQGNTGSASNGVVNRQSTNTVVTPRANTVVAVASTKKTTDANTVSGFQQSNDTGIEADQEEVLAATDEADQGCSELLGVCWYWWPVGLVGVGLAATGVVLYRRNG